MTDDLDALRADRFLLVGVQKVEPFNLFTVEVSRTMLGEGRAKYLRLLHLLQPKAEVPAYLSEAVRDITEGLNGE